MASNNLADEIPSIETLEERFLFIEDKTLRINISLTFQYIIFLIAVSDQENTEKSTVGSTIHKSMIIHTASIIEGCLHYCLQTYIETNQTTEADALGFDKKLMHHKDVYETETDGMLCTAFQVREPRTYSNELQLLNLIRACEKAGILDKETYKSAEKIRKLRNKVHLAGLGEIDAKYTKANTQDIFKDAADILNRIEALLLF
ncbi:MAG: hypothetical protein AAGA35_02155 [Patescibacteria group bacterium]